MFNKVFVISVIAALMVVLSSGMAVAGPKTKIFQKGGYAIRGYDPVAYFTSGEPAKGDEQFSTTYNGATWLFSSAENMELFKADPVAYAPQYGGYCAWAIANDKLVKTDPKDWKIHEGKLYVNYSAPLRNKWEADPEKFIAPGNANWAKKEPTLVE